MRRKKVLSLILVLVMLLTTGSLLQVFAYETEPDTDWEASWVWQDLGGNGQCTQSTDYGV